LRAPTDVLDLLQMVDILLDPDQRTPAYHTYATFPKVDLKSVQSLEWLPGLSTIGADGRPAVIAEAKQQATLKMNEKGARARAADEMRARRGFSNATMFTVDQPFLLRTRAYLAVKNKFDPFRFTVEISDARRFNSDFPRDVRDSNFQEPIQLYGELFFKQSWVADKQLSLKFGRQAFEYTDRRLLARNEFRNTTNNFDGIRAILGKQSDEWQLDALLLQPILRDDNGFDKRDKANTLLGLIGDYRGISQYITLQPLYLVLKQDGNKISTGIEREIHTIGLRGYGIVGKTGFDYDFSYNKQVGNDGPRKHDALGYTGELGYTFAQPWKPRLSATWNFGSGDDNPNDQQSGRFDRLFGFARPFSQDDYFQFENIEATKIHFELTPSKTLQWDAGFSWYSLNSATDRWNNAGLRDPTGQSGTYVGHEADTRLVWTPSRYFQTELLYAYFKSGTFAENAGRGGTSNLFFAQFTFSAF
ncbi:alginate export family protein, partial [uncultured Nevskia sp.]|uniref:alginate export family protein n=1 Tax=uncultured Nevskia sp. TaxID=228950 RepID=UPI0025D7502B